jgi:hypothetical protein
MKKNKHPLRDATPVELANYLDAYVLDPDPGLGWPGFELLRDAWAGRVPYEPALEALPSWVEQQVELQLTAQQVYEALVAVEPIRDPATGAIAGWFATKWAEVLLALPWDERLESAIAEAVQYVSVRVGA